MHMGNDPAQCRQQDHGSQHEVLEGFWGLHLVHFDAKITHDPINGS